MTHAYEIRHHASGEFWIYVPQELNGKLEFCRFIGPFVSLLAAEGGLERLVDQPIFRYDADGRPTE
jgi:hypothetical protein